MTMFDLSVPDLERYLPELDIPSDLDAFWSNTVADARLHQIDVRLAPVENRLRLVDSYDVSFRGFAGDRINAWLSVPAGATRALPTVVSFVGYSGGRGIPFQHVEWALAGYAHLTVDNRGQGWGGRVGSTPDPTPDAGLIAAPGHLTRGILDPATYYYRRVFTDAVRAVDAARSMDLVDSSRIAVAGTSQGGGIAIAVASLRDDLIAAMVDVPFLCHFSRAVAITDSDPYQEIVRYLKRNRDDTDAVFSTLRYFDGAVLAASATAPALFSVALMDATCPPSTVYAAFNRWGNPNKRIVVYPFNQHEGGDEHQQIVKYDWFANILAELDYPGEHIDS
jgi:cephalosporin-C deacetylase